MKTGESHYSSTEDKSKKDGETVLVFIRLLSVLPVFFFRWTNLYMAVVVTSSVSFLTLIVVPAIPGIPSDSEKLRNFLLYPIVVLFAVALFGKLGGLLVVAGVVWVLLTIADSGTELFKHIVADSDRIRDMDSTGSGIFWVFVHFILGTFAAVLVSGWILREPFMRPEIVLRTLPVSAVYTMFASYSGKSLEKTFLSPLVAAFLLYVLYLIEPGRMISNLSMQVLPGLVWLIVSLVLFFSVRKKKSVNKQDGMFFIVSTWLLGFFASWKMYVVAVLYHIVFFYGDSIKLTRIRNYLHGSGLDWVGKGFNSESKSGLSEKIMEKSAIVDDRNFNFRMVSVIAVFSSLLSLGVTPGVTGVEVELTQHLFRFGSILALAYGAGKISGFIVSSIVGRTCFSITELKIVDCNPGSSEEETITMEETVGDLLGAALIAGAAWIVGLIGNFSEFILVPITVTGVHVGFLYTNVVTADLIKLKSSVLEPLGVIIMGIFIRTTLF